MIICWLSWGTNFHEAIFYSPLPPTPSPPSGDGELNADSRFGYRTPNTDLLSMRYQHKCLASAARQARKVHPIWSGHAGLSSPIRASHAACTKRATSAEHPWPAAGIPVDDLAGLAPSLRPDQRIKFNGPVKIVGCRGICRQLLWIATGVFVIVLRIIAGDLSPVSPLPFFRS